MPELSELTEQQKTWMKEMEEDRVADLLPELEDWVVESETFGKALKHPLVYEVPLILPGRSNRAFQSKSRHLRKALAEEDWHQVVFLHERPYRCYALIEYIVGRDDAGNVLPLAHQDQEVRDLAADVWVDSENIGQHIDDWTQMFDGPGWLMGTSEEKEEFDALPDPITVYRSNINDGGWSWSSDRAIAEFFARRFDATDEILVGQIAKDHVFGYLTRRSENEVLVRERALVQGLKVEKIRKKTA